MFWLLFVLYLNLVTGQLNDGIDQDHQRQYTNCGNYPESKV